jgi:uncharacterized membrane protein
MKDRLSREEKSHWKLGVFYINHEDPALWVPKRFSPGMTVNLGHSKGWLILAGVGLLLGIIILMPIVVTFFMLH